jgi:pilus assembly protein CpaD
MHNVRISIGARRVSGLAALRAAFIAGCTLVVGGCVTNQQQVTTAVPDVPPDYRMRHPITITEADHTFELFVGASRGALTPTQRAEVAAFGQSWRRYATGGVIIDVPVGTPNERAAAGTLPEINSILAATGVPPQSIVVRSYRPAGRALATIHITYPKIAAQAGPCGLWPEDVGPSFNRDFFENQPPWNFGCANQRNLAAMVDNPADLVQPRGESPAYTMRRTTVVEKYRQGMSTATQYPNTDSSKISDVGK